MAKRRIVIARVCGISSIAIGAGCLGTDGGSRSNGLSGETDPADGRRPTESDFAVTVVPESEDDGEHVEIESVADEEVSIVGVRLEYPDGTRYTFGEAVSSLKPGVRILLHSQDVRGRMLRSDPPIYIVDAGREDAPVFSDRDDDVALYDADGERLHP